MKSHVARDDFAAVHCFADGIICSAHGMTLVGIEKASVAVYLAHARLYYECWLACFLASRTGNAPGAAAWIPKRVRARARGHFHAAVASTD